MTELDLDAIEALAAAATRGPWVLYPTITRLDGNELAWTISRPYCEKANDDPCDDDCGVEVLRTGAEECEEDWMRGDDASFIASARADVPALVAEVRRLRAAVDAALALHQRNPAPSRHWEPCLGHIPNWANRERAGGWAALQAEMDACSVCTSTEHWHCSYDSHHECGHEDYPCDTARALTAADPTEEDK